jgi:nucleotide-binding universal stress UspA family protein
MTTIRAILCATDLSPASEAAWDTARLLGRLLGAELTLLHVLPPPAVPLEGYFPPEMYQELLQSASREAQAGLDAWLAREPGLKARARLVEGPIGQRILDVAREEQADLVTVGSHGRTGLGRALLGSIADRVVRTAPCPVLTVRPTAAGAVPSRIARILFPTDFSPNARAAWPWVTALAGPTGAEVDLLHVTAQPVPDQHLPPALIERMARLLEEQGQAEAERFLQHEERQAPGRLPPGRVTVLIGRGVVGEQIAHWARSRGADLIVMGTHGWSGVVRWMLGSVAHHLVQTAPCPVLTVGPAGQERAHAP